MTQAPIPQAMTATGPFDLPPSPASEPTDIPAPTPEQLPGQGDTPPMQEPPVNPDTPGMPTPEAPENPDTPGLPGLPDMPGMPSPMPAM